MLRYDISRPDIWARRFKEIAMEEAAYRFPVKTKSMRRREFEDAKLVREFGEHERYVGLDWYTDSSTESRHRCVVFKCTCGREMRLMPSSLRKGYNPQLLCSNCVTPVRRRGRGSINPKYLPTENIESCG